MRTRSVDLASVSIDAGDGRSAQALDLVDSWAGNVLRLFNESIAPPENVELVWGADDWVAALYMRDRVQRAIDSRSAHDDVPATVQVTDECFARSRRPTTNTYCSAWPMTRLGSRGGGGGYRNPVRWPAIYRRSRRPAEISAGRVTAAALSERARRRVNVNAAADRAMRQRGVAGASSPRRCVGGTVRAANLRSSRHQALGVPRHSSAPRSASTRPTTATARAHVHAHPHEYDDDDHANGAAADPVPSESSEAEKKRSA
jgi:hypothetical protein